MITYVDGDILESQLHSIAIPVNVVGVMGAGLARQFAKKYSDLVHVYRGMCHSSELTPATPAYIPPSNVLYPHPGVLFFPTKKHYRDPSVFADIKFGLNYAATCIRNGIWKVPSLAIPRLGCGLGGLDWPHVRDAIVESFGELDMDIHVYSAEDVCKRNLERKKYE